MRILYATAEVDPFSKVGGLADVAASLPPRLQELGHDIRVVAPCHKSSLPAFHQGKCRDLLVELPSGSARVELSTVKGIGGVPVELVNDSSYFGRESVYGEPDDLMRYQFFCRAIAALLVNERWTPDIIHLNDWHTAPLAFALRNLAWSNAILRGVASVFTIHNLRYRGPDEFNDFLAQAIYYSDVVTTVSPTYAHEILTRELGEGLDPLLALRHARGDLRGILNGINYDTFNPRTDPGLTQRYDLVTVEERQANRDALRNELGLRPATGPVVGMVGRLTEQKGIDLVIQALPEILASHAQLVVLGQGEPALEADLRRLQEAHPGAVHIAARFDEPFARRIYAGADILLMPSRYEPCGLGQMIGMRYGCVPVARRTGGLADTILDLDEHPETGTGFLFDEFSSFGLEGAFERAVRAFRDPATWGHLQRNGMSRDYSWRASATHYVEAYTSALRARGIMPME